MWYITGFVYDLNKKRVRLFRMNSDMPDGMGSEVFQAANVILQQFTGLEDKSEKDVYEGDIVDVTVNTSVGLRFNKAKVIFESGSFFAKGNGENEDYEISGIIFDIVGNVHENPDLI